MSQPEPERSAISEPERDPVLLLGESTVAPSTPSAYVPAGVPEPTPSATYVPRDVPQSVSQSQHTGEPVRESQRQPEPVRDPFGESFSGLLVFMF